jgi:hypothetical protein
MPQTKPLDTFLLVDGSDTRLHQLHLLFLGGDAILVFNSGKDPPALFFFLEYYIMILETKYRSFEGVEAPEGCKNVA